MPMVDSGNVPRILVVGDTGVGKTLFLRRLRQVMLPCKNDILSTWGPTIGFFVDVFCANHHQRRLSSSSNGSEGEACVAFIELGGNRNFGHSSHFSISLLSFDGVIFLYDRHNANSAIGLSCWYEDLKSYGIVGKGGSAKVMLLETVLSPPTAESVEPANKLPDELLGTYLQTRSVKEVSRWEKMFKKVRTAAARWVGGSRLCVSDFQQGGSSFRLRVAVWFFYLVSRVENLMLFIVAVLLFGPYQQSVSLHRPSVTEALATIRADAGGTQTPVVCPLYDQLQFEASAFRDVMSFIDSLKEA